MKDIQGIPVVISRGTPYEIGLNHGRSNPDRVAKSFEYNLKSCIDNGFAKEELYKVAMGFVKPVEKYNKDYIEEITGIADGSGLKFEDLMVLNSRTELQKLIWNRRDADHRIVGWKAPMNEACTSIAVTGERTADGAVYVGQNWDNDAKYEECLHFHVIEQANGKPTIASCGEAGIICRSGMNSFGIGDGVNSLTTDAPVDLEGVPLQFLLRGVLDSRDLGEAITALNLGRNATVNNILIAQKDNEAISVELDSGCAGILYARDSILTHANHYVAPGHPRPPYLDKGNGSTFIRHNRSDKLLRAVEGKITMDDVWGVFSDHGNRPASICRHTDPTKERADQCETVFSFLCNLTTMEMYMSPAKRPCEGYVKLRPFDWLKEE